MGRLGFLFYGTVFLASGLGVTLSQIIGEKLVSGVWFMGIGFLLLIISFFISTEVYIAN